MLLLVLLGWITVAQGAMLPRVVVETEAGEFELEIDTVRAPATAANFLKYVEAGLYDGGRFHRTVTTAPDNQPDNAVKIDVIQGAANAARRREYLPAIPLERTSVTGLAHLDGTVSMARSGPDTARDEFFICVGDQPSLDFGGARQEDGQGFAAFGRVIRGMDVVRRIHMSRADGQRLAPSVRILAIRRRSRDLEGQPPMGWMTVHSWWLSLIGGDPHTGGKWAASSAVRPAGLVE